MKRRSILLSSFLSLGLLYGCGSDSSGSGTPTFTLKGDFVGAKSSQMQALMAITGGVGGGGTPASFKMLFLKLWLSENADCSNPILVSDVSADPQYVDFTQNPTLLSGSVPAGTYNCMIYQAYDTMLFTSPASGSITAGHETRCQGNTTYGMDVFRDAGEVWYDYENNTTINAAGDMYDSNIANTPTLVEQYSGNQVITFFSTTGTNAGVRAAYPNIGYSDNGTAGDPSDDSYYQILPMTAPLVIASGNTSVSIVYDFTNTLKGTMDDGGDPLQPLCWVEGFTTTIRND